MHQGLLGATPLGTTQLEKVEDKILDAKTKTFLGKQFTNVIHATGMYCGRWQRTFDLAHKIVAITSLMNVLLRV